MSTKTAPEQTVHEQIKVLSMNCSFGTKDPYNLKQGIDEFAREFRNTGEPFGHANLKNVDFFYVDELSLKDPLHKNLFHDAKLVRTSIYGVYYLREGVAATVPVEPASVRSLLPEPSED